VLHRHRDRLVDQRGLRHQRHQRLDPVAVSAVRASGQPRGRHRQHGQDRGLSYPPRSSMPAIGMVYRSDRATSIGIVAVAVG